MYDWAHVVTSTRGHWVPGDERGFRNRERRALSTGDYKNPPPPEEHSGLRRYARGLASPTVVPTPDQRRRVGEALIEKLRQMEIETVVLACGALHTHVLMKAGELDAVEILGRAKQFASHRLHAEIPGKLWGSSSHVERVVSSDRFWETTLYIADHAEDGAWVWIDESNREEYERRRKTRDMMKREDEAAPGK